MAAMRMLGSFLRAFVVVTLACAGLALGAHAVGQALPPRQLVFSALYGSTASTPSRWSITLVDVARGINMPLITYPRGSFVVSARGVVAYSGDGFNIVTYDLYSQRWNQLTESGEYEVGMLNAAWSPDGTQLAFVAADQSRFHLSQRIFVIRGDEIVNLMPESSFRAVQELAWSPDGTRIAFTGYTDNNSPRQAYVLDVGSGAMRVLLPDGGESAEAAWSPRGERIALSVNNGSGADIYVMNSDGSDAQNLTQGIVRDTSPLWSPDGTRIAYLSSTNTHTLLSIMNADGSERSQLVNLSGEIAHVSWSPDGTMLAFEHAQLNEAFQIYVVEVNSGAMWQVSFATAGTLAAWVGQQ